MAYKDVEYTWVFAASPRYLRLASKETRDLYESQYEHKIRNMYTV